MAKTPTSRRAQRRAASRDEVRRSASVVPYAVTPPQRGASKAERVAYRANVRRAQKLASDEQRQREVDAALVADLAGLPNGETVQVTVTAD